MIIALLISLFLLLGMPMMGQMMPINLPTDGDWPTIVGDSIMLIGPQQNELTEEQRYFNPVYLMTYPGKEHLKEQMIRAALCDCDPTQPNRRIGVFSVAPDKQVSFSQGNLQYLPAANIWKFADTQYEYLGNANKYLTPTFRNWVDLFGWSANNTTAPFGVSISTNVANYAGAFVDWGTNTICGDAPNTWRTLSANEWKYLFEQRKNALQLRSKGSVNGHRGHILLPDDWVLPEGVQFVAEPDNLTMELEINTYTPAEWSIMEEAGAVFLPAAGRRDGTTVGYLVEYSGVWSSTSTTNTNAFHTYYNYESQIIEHHWTSATSRINGRSVRLVHDTIVPKVEPEYVDLGLSVKWATFNVGASKPEDYGDYFAWGETEPKETYSWATYKWGTSSNLTKYNTTDGKTTLEPEDDAAYVNWGGKWRMPTKEEMQELFDKCTWTEETRNGINGHIVTGPNGNSIFLPIAGFYNKDEFGEGIQKANINAYYWTNSKTIDLQSRAYDLGVNTLQGEYGISLNTRRLGFPIRPVYDDSPPKRIGVFSVSADKQVSFSQGNLQYTQSTDEWHFAREQYEYIGAANIKDGALADKIDLFGWSANNTTAPFGVSLSTNNADYAGEFVDWGTNIIQGDAANTWRTLSKEEWEYLIKGRKNASNLRAAAQVNGVNGMILLPDDWECPEGIDFKAGYHTSKGSEYYAEYQQFTKEQWRELETTGAIFIPAAGMHDGNGIADIQAGGYYWSATDNGDTYAYTLISQSSGAYLTYDNRYDVRSVRLVHDTIVPAPEPEYVDLGLSVKWATFNVGATSPEDYGDYFAWGETEPKETYNWATYKWCQGTANTFTKYCSNSQYGNADYKTTLDPEDDAAIVHLGGDWRMPTIEEWMELKQNCTWKKITINGITGCQVTAKNGNSIFLPRAGLRMSNILYAADSVGYYASSNHLPEFSHEDYASYMLMYDSSISKSSAVRYYGLPIRPVYDDIPDPCLVVKVNDTLSINMMCVEGGTFMMGATDNDEKAKDDEKPAHKVTLTYDYHIMQTEVTQGLWEAVMGEDIYVAQTKMANASKPAYVGGDYPMYYVRMNDALEFIDKLNAMTGMHFRLPTEAEWEYAARGGNKSKGYLYAGSNNADDVGWYYGRGGLHRAAQLKPNELGIYDMSGNVSEMCLDFGTYGETYKAGDAVNPRGNIRSNGNRFWRGGSYTHSKDSMRVSQRSSYTPSWGGTWLGLRLVLAEDNDFRTIRVGNSYFDMSFVKGGTFMMGSDASGAEADEQPVHEVTLSDYYIGQTEVTQHLWKKVMGDDNNPSAVKGNNLPVTNITWDEAQQFVERLSELTGMRFRLPTEAEWEYAARGGQKSKGYTYAGSDDIDEVGWYNGNSSNKTHAVGQKQPNELGIYDMTGNIWEYCFDWHTPYSAQAQTNPTGAATGEKHVLRGGCYHYDSKNCTSTNRHSYYTPDNGGASTGLRIVLEVDK